MNKIDAEAKMITGKLNPDDRVGATAQKEAFITRPSFQ